MQKATLQKTSQWTILEVLTWTTGYFSSYGIDSPRLTAELLLADVLEIERIALYVRFDQPLSDKERNRYRLLVKRRILGEPVAYILGKKDFWTIELELTPDVLIPRPETEILVETALELMPEKQDGRLRVIDMGTGSGAVVISLAHSKPGPVYFACDISYPALRLAARNAALNKVIDRIAFFASDWFESISNSRAFDVILSNPPYIPSETIPTLEPEIREHEPKIALDGDIDGLRDLGTFVSKGFDYLVSGGFLMLEIGHGQKEFLVAMVQNQPACVDLFFRKDYGGHDRVAVLKKQDRK